MTEPKPAKAPDRFLRLLKNAMQDHPDAPSLREVSRRADLSPAYLSRLLNGERGIPSNDAIAQLERVLDIPEGDLFKAAARPDDQALEFFRKDEAGSIMRTLAPLPNSQLATVHKMIERFLQKETTRQGQMKHRLKNTLRGLSRHFGLKVKFVHYLGDNVHGKLLPRENRILINARKSRNEHVYTALHEIGHFFLHFKSRPRKHHPRFFDIQWKAEWLARFNSKVRRCCRFIFNKETGKEYEADLWAMCAFVHLANRIGCRDELRTFLERHPEKWNPFLLAALGNAYTGTKTRIKKLGAALAMPFQTLWNS